MTSRSRVGQGASGEGPGQTTGVDMQGGGQGVDPSQGGGYRLGSQRDGEGGRGEGKHGPLARRQSMPRPLLSGPMGSPPPQASYPLGLQEAPSYPPPQFQPPFLVPPAPPPPVGPPPASQVSPLPCQACRKARVYCDKTQPCERCRRLRLECLPQLKSRGRKVVPTGPVLEGSTALGGGGGGRQKAGAGEGAKNIPAPSAVPSVLKQPMPGPTVSGAKLEVPFAGVASRQERAGVVGGKGGASSVPPSVVTAPLGGGGGDGKRLRVKPPSPPSSPEEVADDVLVGASLVQALGMRAHVSSGAAPAHSTAPAKEGGEEKKAQEDKAEAKHLARRKQGRGRGEGRGGQRTSSGWQRGKETLAQEVWREREEEASSLRGLRGEGCLLLSQEGPREGGLTWSEMCCRAILRLRTRGAVDQAKMDFIRVHAVLFRLTETLGGRELLRVMADPDGLPDKPGPPLHCLGAPLPSSPLTHPTTRAGTGVQLPRQYTQHEEVKHDDEAAPGSASAGLRWAEEVLRTPHTFTLGLYIRAHSTNHAIEIAAVCNEGMEREIVSAIDLKGIAEKATVLPVFAPAWIMSRRTLYSFCIGTVTTMFGRDRTLEHHGVVKLVRRSGDCIRCLCTQRSFQGPDDGVCRLLAMRFWPLAHMFDFRRSAGSALSLGTHYPPVAALEAAEAEERRQRMEEGEGEEGGEGEEEEVGEGKSERRRTDPSQGPSRWVEA